MNTLLVFFYLQALDVVTTVVGLVLGIGEGNPLTKKFISHFGAIPGLLVVKLICIVLVVSIFFLMNRRNSNCAKRAMLCANWLTMVTVIYNIAVCIIFVRQG